MPRINLLPHRAAARQKRKKDFISALVAAAIAAGVITWATNWMVDSSISNQRARNAILQNEIAELDKQIEEIKGLENQRERLIARMKVIGELQRARPEVVHLFDELVKAVPEGVHLTEVKQIGTRIELQGVAQSSTRVSTLMRNIDASDWLSDPGLDVVQTVASGPEHQSQFKLFAQQVVTSTDDDAKSDAKTGNAKPAPAKPAPAKPGNANPNKGAAK
ncbi:MAG TPA: PilN domain-containing protein [Gammaproteobacteria bacterium]|nr:PilN domain-containing protein [Gammaproteobacteria bacterium]